MGLLIKFEMQFHMTDSSTSGCNLSLNIATQGSDEQQQNKPMPMLDPCKNVHVEIQQSVYPDHFSHRG